jgi:hypothetical protein
MAEARGRNKREAAAARCQTADKVRYFTLRQRMTLAEGSSQGN